MRRLGRLATKPFVIGSRRPEERGSILILSAIVLTAMVTASAFSLDISRQSYTNRQLHSLADIAAQDAEFPLGTPTAYNDAVTAATESLSRNGFTLAVNGGPAGNTMTLVIGTWDTTVTPAVFRPVDDQGESDTDTVGTVDGDADSDTNANAVKVTLHTTGSYFLQPGGFSLTASAVAECCVMGVEAGTYAAQADLDNALLGLSGGEAITALGWQGLASTTVTLDQLRAAGSFAAINDLLTAQLSYSQMLTILTKAIDPSGQSTAQAAVASRQLASEGSGISGTAGAQVSFGSLFSTGYGAVAASSQTVSEAPSTPVGALFAVMGGWELALVNDHSVVNATLPTSLSIPGVTNVGGTLSLVGLEGPQHAWGHQGVTATTAQIRAQLTLTGSVTVGLPYLPLPVTFNVSLPIALQGFGASAQAQQVSCDTNTADLDYARMDIWTTPSAATAGIGTVASLANPLPASLPSVPLISLGGTTVLSGSTETTVLASSQDIVFYNPLTTDPFTGPEPARGPKTASVVNVGSVLDNAITGAGNNLVLGGGSPLPLSTLESVVLNPVLDNLQSVMTTVEQSLGIDLVGADVWNPAVPGTLPRGFSCTTPSVVA